MRCPLPRRPVRDHLPTPRPRRTTPDARSSAGGGLIVRGLSGPHAALAARTISSVGDGLIVRGLSGPARRVYCPHDQLDRARVDRPGAVGPCTPRLPRGRSARPRAETWYHGPATVRVR